MRVFRSNRLEVLSDWIAEHLFSANFGPFDKRLVIVPNQNLKNYLTYYWANSPSLKIAAGPKIITLGQAVQRFFPYIPSKFELSLRIEEAVLSFDEKECPLLFTYLKKGSQKRVESLSNYLSSLFLAYIEQGEAACQKWAQQEGWQQLVWNKIFPGSFPGKCIQSAIDPIYLFNINFLPQLYFDFFEQNNSYYFLTSPSEMFLEDVWTPKEQRFILQKEKQASALEPYFEGQNLFLTHLGKLNRQYTKALELVAVSGIEDRYVHVEAKSYLEAIQNSVLTFEPINQAVDQSVQIHAATSKKQEVEIVWEIIQGISIPTKDILILAPDIMEYLPYIHMVFGKEESGLDYSISSLEQIVESPLAQSLERLLNLPSQNYESQALLALFSQGNFLNKFTMTEDDVQVIREWIEKGHIRGGRSSLDVNSWESGLGRLIDLLALTSEENEPIVELSQADLLGNLITISRLIAEKLKPIENNASLELSDWVDWLNDLIASFFTTSASDEGFLRDLDAYAKITSGKIDFGKVSRLIKEICKKRSGRFNGSRFGAVKFSSLKQGFGSITGAVFVLGMQEGAFPSNSARFRHFELKGGYIPSANDEDRALFLELILSTRAYFIMTYASLDPEDGKEVRPSVLVDELFQDVPVHHHPKLSFDKAYFQGPFRSYSLQNFQAAKSYYNKGAGNEPFFISLPPSLQTKKSLDNLVIDIRHLKKLGRHPIEFFLERHMGIYTKREKNRAQEFSLSYLDLSYYRRLCLKNDLNEILRQADEKGMLPSGRFKEVALRRIQEDACQYLTALSELGVDKSSLFSIEMKASCTAPVELRKGEWIFPSLEIALKDGRRVNFLGKIENISPKGMIFHGEDTLEDRLRVWPLYLIFLHLRLKTSSSLLFTKDKKAKENFFSDPKEALLRYISYYETSLEHMSPLVPNWSKSLILGNAQEFSQEVKSASSALFPDPILDWILSIKPLCPSAQWFELWSPLIREVFREEV